MGGCPIQGGVISDSLGDHLVVTKSVAHDQQASRFDSEVKYSSTSCVWSFEYTKEFIKQKVKRGDLYIS